MKIQELFEDSPLSTSSAPPQKQTVGQGFKSALGYSQDASLGGILKQKALQAAGLGKTADQYGKNKGLNKYDFDASDMSMPDMISALGIKQGSDLTLPGGMRVKVSGIGPNGPMYVDPRNKLPVTLGPQALQQLVQLSQQQQTQH
jgi:hypothetical protein